ncbi:hypothetical protein [Bacillus sp. mrc49]|uniref:hypothetical protein n=1 Tax=Bacillus sp. mrc49 TaxID=2054913 RepID=UPI000C275F0E|nr:hypothetical protein [Bacillus sp. mrc49]PJN90681.1 hypothetical protein CVN76_09185 [Bacillus sp. mrc49]
MIKQYIIFFGLLLFVITPLQTVKAETVSNSEREYFTTEDIVADIVFPSIDRIVTKEYEGDYFVGWQWKRIVGITYNNNHSYDVSIKIEVPLKENPNEFSEDLIKVRISPSCDSEKLNKQLCDHDFKMKILEYKHLSQ